jgi:hypothetical protein
MRGSIYPISGVSATAAALTALSSARLIAQSSRRAWSFRSGTRSCPSALCLSVLVFRHPP